MKAKHVLAGAVAALALTLTNVGIAAANEKQPDTSPSKSEFVGHSVHKMVDFSSDIETEEIHGTTEKDGVVFESGNTSLKILPSTEADPQNLETKAAVIKCTLRVDNIHASHHVQGNINGVAQVSCTQNVKRLDIHYSLIRISPNRQWAAPSKTNGGKSFIKINRAISCSEGYKNFRGWAQGVVAPPPGYVLAGSASTQRYGNTTFVACGPGILSGSEGNASEVLTVTFIRSDLR